jgi:uncharacterized DUF497 family protein
VAFVWDGDKAASNFRWHGVRFEYATRVFQDPQQLEWVDDREDYGEDRFNVVGLVGDLELFVTFTRRDEDVRIISARRANRYEREEYWRSQV